MGILGRLFSRKKKGDRISEDVDALVNEKDKQIAEFKEIAQLNGLIKELSEKEMELSSMQLEMLTHSSNLNSVRRRLSEIQIEIDRIKQGRKQVSKEYLIGLYGEVERLKKDEINFQTVLKRYKDENIKQEDIEEHIKKINLRIRRAERKKGKLLDRLLKEGEETTEKISSDMEKDIDAILSKMG